MVKMAYQDLLDHLVHLEEMVPMAKKETTNDTEILYKGKAAGSSHDQYGGGANYICLPDEPEFLSYIPGIAEDQSYIYGAEYQNSGPLSSLHDHNVPCVVCYASTRISI